MSAHNVGCVFPISNGVRSPAAILSSMDGRSLCVSISGAFSRSARARLTIAESEDCFVAEPAKIGGSEEAASTVLFSSNGNARKAPKAAMTPECSRKRRRDNTVAPNGSE